MEKPKSHKWRQIQHTFSKDKIEFLQDKRILDFFSNSLNTHTLVYGDTEYFNNKLHTSIVYDALQWYLQDNKKLRYSKIKTLKTIELDYKKEEKPETKEILKQVHQLVTDIFDDNNNTQLKNNLYKQGLIIINELISDHKLDYILKNLKTKLTDDAKICLSINKFLVYARENNDTINDNYDIALLEFVKNIFPERQINHYFIKNVNGNYFNSASPTTQFFIT